MAIPMIKYNRTIKFFKEFHYRLQKNVAIMGVWKGGDYRSEGVNHFVAVTVPKIQYNYPKLQIPVFESNIEPPCIKFIMEDMSMIHCDVSELNSTQIMENLVKVNLFQKYNRELEKMADALVNKKYKNEKAHTFGYDCSAYCICERPGQAPCPGHKSLPMFKGKFFKN